MHSLRICRTLRVALFLMTALVRPGGAELPCTITQLTSTTDFDYGSSAASRDARWISTIRSSALFDIHRIDAESGLDAPVAVFGNHFDPQVTDDGQWVFFTSDVDLAGANPDGNREMFGRFMPTGEITQYRSSVGPGSRLGHVAPDGSRLIFHTTGNPTGGNADGSTEHFLFNRDVQYLEQLTNGTTPLHGWAVDDFCGRFAHSRPEDPTGQNPDLNVEVFLRDRAAGTFVQVTQTSSGYNFARDLDGDGSHLLFMSSSPEYTYPFPGGGIFLFVMRLADRSVTAVNDFSSHVFDGTELSTDGTRVVASLSCQATIWDLQSRKSFIAFDVSNSLCTNPVWGLSDDGSRFFVSSTGNPGGQNPDGSREVFRIDCPREIFVDGFELGSTERWSSSVPRTLPIPGSMESRV